MKWDNKRLELGAGTSHWNSQALGIWSITGAEIELHLKAWGSWIMSQWIRVTGVKGIHQWLVPQREEKLWPTSALQNSACKILSLSHQCSGTEESHQVWSESLSSHHLVSPTQNVLVGIRAQRCLKRWAGITQKFRHWEALSPGAEPYTIRKELEEVSKRRQSLFFLCALGRIKFLGKGERETHFPNVSTCLRTAWGSLLAEPDR